MTTQRDFKRLVRGRMHKTGESYTAARAQLLRARPPRARAASLASAAPAALVTPAPAELEKIAGIKDATLKEKTGCTWERWVRALDHKKAYQWSHGDIATFVHDTYKTGGWWAQLVTVGYERIKGLRAKGQRRDGAWEANRSKTFPVPIARLFRAFRDARTRSRWLKVPLTVRTAQLNKTMRITWDDATSVELYFTAKGRAKSQVQVQHTKLVDQADQARRKAFWTERLDALGLVLNSAKR